MQICSNCSGACEDCSISYIGGCIAGHGDDYFTPITEKTAKKLLKEGKLSIYQIKQLKQKFSSLNTNKI